VTFHLNLGWDTGESAVQVADIPGIEKLAQIMRQYPQVSAVIKGYPDDRGSAQANQRLSEKRAEAVREALVRGFGIAPNRVIVQKFNGVRPAASDPTAEDRRINRWVEAVLIAPDTPATTVSDSDVNP
jgi:OOP family OmpA-OmpF porin